MFPVVRLQEKRCPRLRDTVAAQPPRNPGVFSGHATMVTPAFPLWGKQSLRREAELADLDVGEKSLVSRLDGRGRGIDPDQQPSDSRWWIARRQAFIQTYAAPSHSLGQVPRGHTILTRREQPSPFSPFPSWQRSG
jgi:hypothetical protein